MSEHRCVAAPLLRSLQIGGLLSFGPEGVCLDMQALTVLVGPNGSGKSNLFEVLGLLQAAPSQLAAPIRNGGGIRNWLWNGQRGTAAHVEAVVENPKGSQPLRHVIEFDELDQTFRLVDERVEDEKPYAGHDEPYFFYRFQGGRPMLAVKGTGKKTLEPDDVVLDESILSQRKDPDQYPELAHLNASYGTMCLYREWEFGRSTVLRQPHGIDVRPRPLMENFSNLGMFLSRLRQHPRAKRTLVDKLSDAYEGLADFELNIEGGTVQIVFHEGDLRVPAWRVSDGSLRYLCLLAILLDPEPPPLVGIEEPEMGMHPDLLPKLADLLVDASRRCQLVVTTHSDILVDALSERPDSVVVCEKHEGRTAMTRLDGSSLRQWLDKYRLGELWTRGALGGVRW